MAPFWLIVFGLGWVIFTIAEQIVKMKANEEEKNSLVPNGYAIEYKVSTEAFWEVNDEWNEMIGGLLFFKDPELYKVKEAEFRKYIRKRLETEFPDAYRILDKNNVTDIGYLMRYYGVMKGRVAAYNAGRNPIHFGGTDPQPRPTDEAWYVYNYDDSALKNWNGTNLRFDQGIYNILKEQDAASERELARVRGEWSKTHPI